MSARATNPEQRAAIEATGAQHGGTHGSPVGTFLCVYSTLHRCEAALEQSSAPPAKRPLSRAIGAR
jgi:hypothetical protein